MLSIKKARLCLVAGACLLGLLLGSCATGAWLGISTDANSFWAVSLQQGVVRSLSVVRGSNAIDVLQRNYARVSNSHIDHWSVAVYYDMLSLDDVDSHSMNANQLTMLAAQFLRGIFKSTGKGIALSIYNVPDDSRFHTVFESSASAPIINIRLYFTSSLAATTQHRRVALKRALSIALHEATHTKQDISYPQMPREKREERASLVEGCFRVAALRGSERLFINNDNHPHSLNPVVDASNMGANRVAHRFEKIFNGNGIGVDDTDKREAVAAVCRQVLPSDLTSRVFKEQLRVQPASAPKVTPQTPLKNHGAPRS